MFGKINKEEINKTNEDAEMHTKKEVKDTKLPVKKYGGMTLGAIGSACSVIACVGAAALALTAISSLIGLATIYTVLILAGMGIGLVFLGNKLMEQHHLEVQGV